MSKFKLTQTAAEVQGILNNSLQKPTGLTKTKLVGVGVNGQENIEIGDNLTLANGKLSATGGGVNGLESDAEGNLTASKNLEVDGKLKFPSLNTTFTEGELPVNHAYSSSYGEVVYSSVLSSYAAIAGNWLLSPLFYKKTPQNYGESNPTFVYAYKSDKDTYKPTLETLGMQGTVAVASITIKNADRSLKISYLNSAFKTGGYVIPRAGLITNYSSFVQNLRSNKNLFISVSGFTKSGAPLMLINKDGEPYVRVVNTTTLEESDIRIPQDATFDCSNAELRSL